MGKYTWILILIFIGKIAFAQEDIPKFEEGHVIKVNTHLKKILFKLKIN